MGDRLFLDSGIEKWSTNMNRIGLFVVAGLCLPALGVAVSAAEPDDPIAIVDAIYSQYDDGGEPIDVPAAYFSEGLLKLWRDVDAGSNNGADRAIGFEILTDADENDTINNLQARLHSGNFVVVDFNVVIENHPEIVGDKKYLMFNFDETDDGWKIDDLDWGRQKNTLRGMLAEILELQKLP